MTLHVHVLSIVWVWRYVRGNMDVVIFLCLFHSSFLVGELGRNRPEVIDSHSGATHKSHETKIVLVFGH